MSGKSPCRTLAGPWPEPVFQQNRSVLVAKWRMILRRSVPKPVSWSALRCLTGQMLVLPVPHAPKNLIGGWGLSRSVMPGGWGFYLALAATISAS
jgi:hypothetical protein